MANRVRYTGSKPPPKSKSSDPFDMFNINWWRDNGPAMAREIDDLATGAVRWVGGIPARAKNYYQFEPGDNRNLIQRYKEGFGVVRDVGKAIRESYDATGRTGFMEQNPWLSAALSAPADPILGATILQGAGETILGIKGYKDRWGGQAGQQSAAAADPAIGQGVFYSSPTQGNQGGQAPQFTQGAGVSTAGLPNADRLRIQQEQLIANRKAQRLQELATAPAWVQQVYNYQPGANAYSQAAAPGQGAGGGYYQQAPAQQLRQAQGNYYQAAGNPYAGRVPEHLKRGGQWEKQHNRWVQLNRAARAKANG